MHINCFRFRVYKARKQLAAIDWNFHVRRGQARSNTGDKQLVTRKYNQRTKEWNAKIVKEEKTYGNIPMLMAKILHKRLFGTDRITHHVSLSEDDPAKIAPTIAQAPLVSSAELFAANKEKPVLAKKRALTKLPYNSIIFSISSFLLLYILYMVHQSHLETWS